MSRGIMVKEAYTDGEGRFGFNDLPGNLYHVIVNEDGYLAVDHEVRIDPVSSSTVAMLNIYLTPRETEKLKSPASVTGENTHLTDSAEYSRRVPKAALKEFEKGVKSDRDGKTDDAVRHYQKAIDLAPDFYAARNNLGSDFLSKSQFPEARQQFESVIKVNPSDAAAYFNLGNISLLGHQYEQAEHWVEQGLSKQPDSAFGHFLRGSLDARSGKTKEAEAALRRCLELDPIMSKAHLALANLYLQQKRNDEAVSELKSFLKAFPEDPFAPQARQVLQKLEVPTAESKPQ